MNHTYNEAQIGWFKAGSALNLIKEDNKRIGFKYLSLEFVIENRKPDLQVSFFTFETHWFFKII
jgi:hypothetical protein